MKLTKNNRPYYAKWWFFICLITLGWLTPITKNWYLFLFGESTIAYPVNIYGKSAFRHYSVVFDIHGKQYVISKALNLREKIPDKCIRVYYHKKNPGDNFTFNLDQIYKSQNLFFPLGLQIGLAVFFLLARFNEINE